MRFYPLIFAWLILSCQRVPYQIQSHYNENTNLVKPNYALKEYWAALPDQNDPADQVPLKSDFTDNQALAKVDVFFIHPTIYTQKPQGPSDWNADVNDADMNQKVDESTILNQASVFNGSCRVYAPRYRQAHYHAFVTKDLTDKVNSLDLAYSDVKASFEYYLQHYNQGRPIVIASHSQGTVHAKRLIKEFFDKKPLQKQFVVAYLVGIATQPNTFESIKACENGDQTGCFVSWNTYARDYYPSWYNEGLNTSISTNPLTWKLDEEFAPRSLSKGGVGLKFTYVPEAIDAQNHAGMLWINKPYVKGRFLLNTKIWHRADYNLFYGNIRENVQNRIDNYWREK